MKEIKICLDAGHYGKYNMSPANSKYYESEVMWKLHLLLKKYLEQYGFKVIQTRDNINQDKALIARGKSARDCDLLLSLHSNAVGSKVNDSVDYPLAIVPINGSANAIGGRLASCIQSVIRTKQSSKVQYKRGVLGDYYGITRGANSVGTPCIILEHSFHTSTVVTNWLLNDKNLAKLARAEADVLADYYGMKFLVVDKAKSFDKSKAGTYSVNSNDGLKLRTGASANHSIIEDMPKGSSIRCYGYHTNEWFYVVSSKGNTGFCHSRYLTETK